MTPIECCGEERNGNFCPQCGKQLRSITPLVSLLDYVRISRASAEKNHKAYKKRAEERGLKEPPPTKVRKWQAWEEALKEILKKEAS